MDIHNRQFLTNEQRLELKEWEKFFKTAAFQWVIDEAAAIEKQLTDFLVLSAATADQMWEARGRINALNYIQNLQTIVEARFNQMTDSAGLTAADLEESQGANS